MKREYVRDYELEYEVKKDQYLIIFWQIVNSVTVTEIVVDDNKQYSVFKLEKRRKTCLDHNGILRKLNLVTAIEKQKKNRIITKCGNKKQEQIDTETDKEDIKERCSSSTVSCDKWSEEVKSNVKKVEKTFGQNLRKDIEKLKRQRKNWEDNIKTQEM